MEVRVVQLLDGARSARGLAVIIDVFRAFTTACFAVAAGARRIHAVADIEEAYRLKRERPERLLMGERGGLIQPGFDYGNSPARIEGLDFSGRSVILTTSAGTQGIAAAVGADEVVSGSFVNAAAVAAYALARQPAVLSLVCMGYEARESSEEDSLCARYLESLVGAGRGVPPFDRAAAVAALAAGSGRRFLDGINREWMPERDFELCLDFDRFDFVLKARRMPYGAVLERLDPGGWAS